MIKQATTGMCITVYKYNYYNIYSPPLDGRSEVDVFPTFMLK